MDWQRLTVDNEDELYALNSTDLARTVLFWEGRYYGVNDFGASIHTLAKRGDIYFYIAPRISVS